MSCRNHMKMKKISYIFPEKFEYKYMGDKKYHKCRDHCRYTGEYRGLKELT